MKLVARIFVVLLVTTTFLGCKKVEGPGGSSSIEGKIYAKVRDGFGNVVKEYYLEKEDVYIIYGGDGTYFDDDIETSYDGSFRFDYLEVGTYQIFVYEKCLPNECESGKRVVLKTVEITEKKSTVDLGTIEIYQ